MSGKHSEKGESSANKTERSRVESGENGSFESRAYHLAHISIDASSYSSCVYDLIAKVSKTMRKMKHLLAGC